MLFSTRESVKMAASIYRRQIYCLPSKVIQISSVISPILSRSVTTCRICFAGQRWREEHKLPPVGNETGPLTDWPDWSYADGRRAPIQAGQKRRLLKQKEYAERIVQLCKEIDFAVEDHKKSKEAAVAHRQMLIDGKLKPKGEKLRSLKKDRK